MNVKKSLSFPYLLTPHGIIQSFALQQLIVRTGLGDPSFFKYIDQVSMHNGGKTMSDQYRDALLAQGKVADRPGNIFFGQRIQRGGSLLEDPKLRIPEQCPGHEKGRTSSRERVCQ